MGSVYKFKRLHNPKISWSYAVRCGISLKERSVLYRREDDLD